MKRKNKGQALLYAIMILGVFAVPVFIFMMRSSMQKKITQKDQAGVDAEATFSRVLGALTSPADCNANFYVPAGTPPDYLSSAGSLIAIKTCSFGNNCRPGVSPDNTQVLMPVTTSTWNSSVTGTTPRVRIVGLNYTITHVQNGTPNDPSMAQLTVMLEKNLGYSNSQLQTRIIQRTIDFPVVLDATLTKIVGCPKSQNSKVVY